MYTIIPAILAKVFLFPKNFAKLFTGTKSFIQLNNERFPIDTKILDKAKNKKQVPLTLEIEFQVAIKKLKKGFAKWNTRKLQ